MGNDEIGERVVELLVAMDEECLLDNPGDFGEGVEVEEGTLVGGQGCEEPSGVLYVVLAVLVEEVSESVVGLGRGVMGCE